MQSITMLCLWVFFAALASAQSATTSDYVGYNLTLEGDEDSTIYSTANTRAEADLIPNPDVYLNASVHVGTIDLEVDNLTAKINLDASVLSLLQFNAGVDLSIDAVHLLIQNVNAKVLLEARLDKLVRMINKTLSSIDLNPIIATPGDGLTDIVNDTVGGLTGSDSGSSSSSSSLASRSVSYELEHNILYSTNNYRANKHTNRVLAQNGDIVAKHLDNDGNALGQEVVGSYESDMVLTGEERETEIEGQEVTEREYRYTPFHGLTAVCAVYFDAAKGGVVGTRVLAEVSGGGSSTVSEDL